MNKCRDKIQVFKWTGACQAYEGSLILVFQQNLIAKQVSMTIQLSLHIYDCPSYIMYPKQLLILSRWFLGVPHATAKPKTTIHLDYTARDSHATKKIKPNC